MNIRALQYKRSNGSHILYERPIGKSGYWYVEGHPIVALSLMAPLVAVAIQLTLGWRFHSDTTPAGFAGALFIGPAVVAVVLNTLIGPVSVARAALLRIVGVVELSAFAVTLLMIALEFGRAS